MFSWSKIAIYLSLCLHKGRPSYRRSLQPSKENIHHFKRRKFCPSFYFLGHFLIRIRNLYAVCVWGRGGGGRGHISKVFRPFLCHFKSSDAFLILFFRSFYRYIPFLMSLFQCFYAFLNVIFKYHFLCLFLIVTFDFLSGGAEAGSVPVPLFYGRPGSTQLYGSFSVFTD